MMSGPEYKTLEQRYSTFVTCIQQSPSAVIDHLRSKCTSEDLAFFENPHHDKVSKARRIVNIVMTQVQNDPNVFRVFTEALKAAGNWTSAIVEILEQCYLASEDEQTRLWSKMPEPTIEELCALPVEKVWYQLGLWLGVDESILQNINDMDRRYWDDWHMDWYFHNFMINDRELSFKKILMFHFLSNFMSEHQAKHRLFHRLFQSKEIIFGNTKDQALGKKLIRKQIVDALVKVGLHKEAEKMCISEGFSFSTYLDLTDPANNPPDYVLEYASYLKKRYQQLSVIPDDWPPPSTTSDHKYSQLALIPSKPIDHHAVESTEKDYLRGNIDRIIAQKKTLTLDELFYPIINKSTNTSRLTILMDGAPGVGKTTIARKLCIDWANGDLLQEYQLVVYVPLREAVGDSVASLLPWPVSTNKADKVAKYLEQLTILGKNTLFIFDGFDELSSEQRSKKSLFMKIIKGDILPDCSVLVASRPYASSKSLCSLSRINRHVKVLGFSKPEIECFIKQNLPTKEAAQTLIKMLEERLDIKSLCYNPLNCKIVLFVFEQQQYKLPTTLTELYETFILHTIKRSVEREEKDLNCNVDRIDDLPPTLLSSLDDLCKVAFDCLRKDQLYLEMRNLVSGNECLSLGLLNSLQAMNSRSLPKEHYQFLHLTFQEFLAARYLASHKFTEDRHTFLLEHIDDVRHRMTLLFLAGLTKLNFIPSNTSLLGDQTIDLTLRKDSEGHYTPEEGDQQKLMLVAHLLYESQIKSLDTPLAFASNTLAIGNADRLSPFDQLVFAHFLSSTPKYHIWNEIHFSGHKFELPSDFILYTTTLSTSEMVAIGMTKCLRVINITISSFSQIISTSTTLRELHCDNFLSKFQHDEVIQICSTICGSKTLETVQIDKGKIRISKEKFSVCGIDGMCSKSLFKLLEFIKEGTLKCVELTNSKAFQDCTSCHSLGSQTLGSLCGVLKRSVSIEQIKLSNCKLNSELVGAIVTALSSKTTLKKLDFVENYIYELDSNSIKTLLELLGTGTELIFFGMHLKPNDIHLQVIKINHIDKQLSAIENIFLHYQFPKHLQLVEFFDITLSQQAVTFFLEKNQHLHQITFTGECFTNPKPKLCEQSSTMVIDAITTHSSLQQYTGPDFKVSNQILHFDFKYICDTSAKIPLKFLDSETAEEMSKDSCPDVSQACTLSTPGTVPMVTLCQIIRSSKCLRYIVVQYCKLNDHFMEMIISFLIESPSEHLESILLSGNAKSIMKLFCAIKKIKAYHCVISIESDHWTLVCSKPSLLNHLLRIIACPVEIQYLTVSLTEHNDLPILDPDVLISLLAANTNIIIELNLPSMELDDCSQKVTCKESLAFTRALLAHTSMQRVSFWQLPPSITISRQALDAGKFNSIICPNVLPHLLAFACPEEVENINMYGNFKNCHFCGSGGELAQQLFVEFLARCVNLKEFCLTHIPDSMIERVLSSISTNEKLQILTMAYSYPTSDSLALVLKLTAFSLTELCMGDLTVTVQDHMYTINSFTPSGKYLCLNTVLQSLTQVSVCQLKKLSFNKGALTDDHIEDFMFFLMHNKITIEFLSFSRNKVSLNFMKKFIKWVKFSTTLKELHLKFLRLSRETVTLLLEALVENKTLNCLDLSSNYLAWYCETSNQIVGPGVALQKLLERNRCLSVLKLSKCYLLTSVIHHIAIGLTNNTTLTELDLCSGDITTYDTPFNHEALIQSILTRNQSLQILSFSSSRLDFVMPHIAKALSTNSTLKELYLDNVIVYDDQWLTLFSALKQNSSLHTLSVCGNRFNAKIFSAIRELLHHNTTITTLRAEDCTCGFSDAELKEFFLEENIRTRICLSIRKAN